MDFNSKSIFRELNYRPYRKQTTKLFDQCKDNLNFVQRLNLIQTLPLHQGCVNTLCWNEAGTLLLSGSDDQHLIVTDGHSYQVKANYRTSHRANIFSAKFLPVSGDHHIVSCSGDGIILYTDLERPSETYYNQFSCHSGTTYEVITIPQDPNTFLSCGEDGTVRWFDLRIKERCKKVRCKEDILISHHRAISALCINPVAPHYLAIGSSDSTVRIFDRRTLNILGHCTDNEGKTQIPVCNFTVPELEDRSYRITSLSYSQDGRDLLVSYSSDHLYLFSTEDQTHVELKKPSQSMMESQPKRSRRSPPPVRRLRLRGDWSDTGPDARPERDVNQSVGIGQARPQLQPTLMERMTNVLFRMLNDPLTRAALSAGGEDSLETNSSQNSQHQSQAATQTDEIPEGLSPERHDDVSMNETETSEELEDSSSDTSNSTMTSNERLTPRLPVAETETKNEQTQTENILEQNSAQLEQTQSSGSQQDGNEISDLRNQLSTLRDGFIEKHGSEPSVSLHYSEQSSTSSTIKLGVSNELDRSNYSTNLPSSSSEHQETGTSSVNTNNLEFLQNVEDRIDTVMNDLENVNEAFDTHQGRIESSYDIEVDYSDSDEEPKNKFCDTKSRMEKSNRKIVQPQVKQKYIGHRNARTMIKEATFWGNDFVMSGSDCGHVFIWDRVTAEIVMLLQADHHVVNCLQPHPTLPILATSGIDHDIKLWAPTAEEPHFDVHVAEDLMKRNEVMLEETRDTITVPAAFMIRMLACLNQIRRTGSLQRSRRREDSEPDSSNANSSS